MSILSNLKSQTNVAHLLARINNKVCFLCYIVGLIWFLMLAHYQMSSPTYFSENALLPGLVDPEFYHDFGAEGYHNELAGIMKERYSSDDMYQIPTKWLLKKFRSLGLDAYTQNYTFKYPFGIYYDKILTGQNVYAIYRAPRTAGTEALVLSVPFSPDLEGSDVTYPGIALLLALAKSFRRNSYWAKDIIFLVTDNKEIGIQAWLSSYHHVPNKYIKAEVLPDRSGSIQAAINLELTSKIVGRVNVKFEGVNGRLPNLDLFNTVERLFYREGLRIVIQKRIREYSSNEWIRYIYSLKLMMTMMWNQAPGIPTGNHGYFHKFNIDAVTIQGLKTKNKKQLDFVDVGRALEGIFRSLNNLLERFHQSFFFYLLPSPDRYISIGVYMPPLGIMILPIAVKIFSFWLTMVKTDTDGDEVGGADGDKKKMQNIKDKETENDKTAAVDTKDDNKKDDDHHPMEDNARTDKDDDDKNNDKDGEKVIGNDKDGDDIKVKNDDDGDDVVVAGEKDAKSESDKCASDVKPKQKIEPIDKLSHAAHLIMSLSIGFCAFHFDNYFVRSSERFGLGPEEGLIVCQIIIHMLIISHPFMIQWYTKGKEESFKINKNFLNCLTLILFGMVLGTISVMNISMGFFVATLWIPIVLINYPTKYTILKLLKYIILIVLSPLGILIIGGLVNRLVILHQPISSSERDDWQTLSRKVWYDIQDGLLLSSIQYYLFDVWTYPLLNLIFLPIWSLFWLLAVNND